MVVPHTDSRDVAVARGGLREPCFPAEGDHSDAAVREQVKYLVAFLLAGCSTQLAATPAPAPPPAPAVVPAPTVAPMVEEKRGPVEKHEPVAEHEPVAAPTEDDEAQREAELGMKLLEDPGPAQLSAPDHLKKACDLGHAGACNDLGWAWSKGFGMLEQDSDRAAELYERSCELGEALGCLNRGRVARSTNTALAARYMAKACAQEDEKACAELAGTVEEAKAACEDDAAECNNWGYIQEHGYGVPASATAALGMYEHACRAKRAVACFNAGVFRRDGLAGASDAAKARAHFKAACTLGNDKGCLALHELAP
jgi:TPR repeat protein